MVSGRRSGLEDVGFLPQAYERFHSMTVPIVVFEVATWTMITVSGTVAVAHVLHLGRADD